MAFLLLIPFFLVRFGLLYLLNRTAVKRAAYFAPLLERERAAYWLYQISNLALFVYLFFLRVEPAPIWLFGIGAVIYGAGLILLILSVFNFASPSDNGMNRSGLYSRSRNPMYVAYFVFFMGCVLLTQSLALFAIVLVFQLASHWIIRSEERWCIQKFGEAYRRYMEEVRRYL